MIEVQEIVIGPLVILKAKISMYIAVAEEYKGKHLGRRLMETAHFYARSNDETLCGI